MDEPINSATFHRAMGLALYARLQVQASCQGAWTLNVEHEYALLVREVGVNVNALDKHTIMRLAGVRGKEWLG